MGANTGADAKVGKVSDGGTVHVPDASAACSAEVYSSLGKGNMASTLNAADKAQPSTESTKFLDGFSIGSGSDGATKAGDGAAKAPDGATKAPDAAAKAPDAAAKAPDAAAKAPDAAAKAPDATAKAPDAAAKAPDATAKASEGATPAKPADTAAGKNKDTTTQGGGADAQPQGKTSDATPQVKATDATPTATSVDPKFQVHDQSLGKEDRTDVNAAMLTLNNNNNDFGRAINYLDPKSPNFSERAAEVGQRLQAMTDKGLYDNNMVSNWNGAVAKASGKDTTAPQTEGSAAAQTHDGVASKTDGTAPKIEATASAAAATETAAVKDKAATSPPESPTATDSGSTAAKVDPKFTVHDQSLGKEDRTNVNAAMLTLSGNSNAVDKAINYLDPKSPNFSERAAEVGQRLQSMTDNGRFDKNMVSKWDSAVAKASGKDVAAPTADAPPASKVAPPESVAKPASTAPLDASQAPATVHADAPSVPPTPPKDAQDGVPRASSSKPEKEAAQNPDAKFAVHDQSLSSEDRSNVNAAMLTLNSNNNDLDRAIKYLDPKSPNFSQRATEVGERLQSMTDKGSFDHTMVSKWDKAVSDATGKKGPESPTIDHPTEPSRNSAEAPVKEKTAAPVADVATAPRSEPTSVNPDPKFRVHDQNLGKEDRMSVNSAMLTLNSNNNDFGRAINYLDPKSPSFTERSSEVGKRLQTMVDKGLFNDDMVAKWDKQVASARGN